MTHHTGATWEIIIDGRPRSYRDDLDVAREAARYLKSKHPKSDVAVRNYVTGELLSTAVEHPPIAWGSGKRAPR